MSPALSMNSDDLGRKGGVKRPFLLILLPYCVGIALADYIKAPLWSLFTLTGIFLAFALYLVNKEFKSFLFIAIALVFLGAAHLNITNRIPPGHIAGITGGKTTRLLISGVVKNDPAERSGSYNRNYYDFLLETDGCYSEGGWRKASGTVKVSLRSGSIKPNYADRVILRGILTKPRGLKNPGLFDYERYSNRNGIYALLYASSAVKDKKRVFNGPIIRFKRAAYYVRDKTSGVIDKIFADDNRTGGFLKAILIGDRSGLNKDDNDSFIKTGTVHILSISGTHIALVAGIALFIFAVIGIPKKASFIITAASIIFYSFIAGLNPPIVRAAIMFAILAVGYTIERDADLLNVLSFAALAILIYNPNGLFDPGFQLSFLSVAGIIIFVPKFDDILRVKLTAKRGLPEKARFYTAKSFSVSVAAWTATMPLVLYYYYIISPASIIANLVIIPLMFIIMIFAVILVIAGLLAPSLSMLLAAVVKMLYNLMVFSNDTISNLPFAFMAAPRPPFLFFIAYYLFALAIVMPHEKIFNRMILKRAHIFILSLTLLNIVAWQAALSGRCNLLKLNFLDVGKGDSAVIQLPDKGGVIVIDAGSGQPSDMGRNVVAPFLWSRGIRKIDAVIITHPHEDHMGGAVYLLRNFSIGCVIDGGITRDTGGICAGYLDTIRRKGIKRYLVHEGDVIDAGGCRFYVLNPRRDKELSDANNDSLVLKFVCKDFNVLFSGDIREKAISEVLKYTTFLESDIIKVPHHGGRIEDEYLYRKFLDAVKPRELIISSGGKGINRRRQDGMENYITIDSINNYDTYHVGGIEVYYDGYKYEIGAKTQ